MEQAVQAVVKDGISARRAAKEYQIPYPGLRRNLKILRGETVPEPSKLELNNLNALSVLVACQQEQANKWSKAINSEDLWHKFIVNNAADGTRELILRSIMNCFAPKEFVIIVIGVDGPDLCFLSRNCGEVILQLCSSNMTVVYGSGYLTLRVLLRFAYCSEMKLSALSFITDALGKRLDPIKKHLDLSDFHKDPDIVDNIFCPLSFSHLFTMVMSALQQPSTKIESVSLANNNLVNLHCLSQLKNIGKEVVKLDLSNNLIRELDELKYLNTLGLKELRLDKNPLCEQYGNEYSYIKAIFQMLPSIMKLDGIDLPGQGLPRHKKNFIVSPDDISLADQFVEYYFTHYDDDRRALKGIYHEKAHFSISASYIHGQKTTVSSMRMSDYTMRSRNLLMISDYSRHVKLLHQGPMAIIDAICKLPKSEHDPYSLKVDLVHSASGVVISVSGVFKEMKNITPIILSFYRVFVLLRTSPVTFQITNEMLCITNPTVMQSLEAFKIPRPPKRKTRDENEGDVKKKYMTNMLSELSSMNRKWSRKCLEEANWDMKDALNSFTALYKISKIPDEAFMKEDQTKSHSFI